MRKSSRFTLHLAACLLVAGLTAACGSKDTLTTITSSTFPSVFYSHAAALKNSSELYIWGANFFGQLGNNDPIGTYRNAPMLLMDKDVQGVSAGGTHTLALMSDGSVKSWGNNGFGQLGNGSLNVSLFPVQVTFSAGTVINGIAAGGSHSLALDASGHIWAWGDNSHGQLGNPVGGLTPTAVQSAATGDAITQITRIAAGGGHSLAVDAATNAYAWGANNTGQLGFAAYSTSRKRAVPVTYTNGVPLTNVTDIAGGGGHSLFVTGDGSVWACGYNAYGQLGLGNTTDSKNGVEQVSFTGVTIKQVAAGLDHSLALGTDGRVWAWGYNFYGQLGNGGALASLTPQKTPVPVLKDDAAHTPLDNIKKIIAIGDSSYAVDNDGSLWAWGDNTFGQLGLGDQTSRIYATKLTNAGTGFDLYHP